MAEIEITTTGEIRMQGNLVGTIDWAQPYIESEVAGMYDDYGHGYDEFGYLIGCGECDDKDDKISELESAVGELNHALDKAETKLKKLEASN